MRRDGLRVPSSTAVYVVERLTALPRSSVLAGILFAMWRDGRAYDAVCLRMPQPRPVRAA